MFVCICNAVREREIREHAEKGVTTLDELRLRTGCSDCCGQCADEAEAILRAVHDTPAPSARPVSRGPTGPSIPILGVQPA